MNSPHTGAQWRSRLKIALLTHCWDEGGGVRVVARWLRDALVATGAYDVDIHVLATSCADPGSRRLTVPGSWVRPALQRRCDNGSVPHWHWGANAVELEFMRYRPRRELTVRLRDYDIVQVVAGSPAWAAAAFDCGVPVVLQVATRVAWERVSQLAMQGGSLRMWRGLMTAITSHLERSALHGADAVLVENATMLDYVRSSGQSYVIKAPPGVDTNVFSPPRTGWRREGPLLSVCRLGEPRKGLHRAVLAYAEMLRQDDSVAPLVLAGHGVPPAPVIDLIATLGLASRIVIRSDVPSGDLAKLYREASVFIQTSYEEGLGVSVLEAMASGLPVVATQTAGSGETVIDGVTGWLVPQDDDQDVVAGIADRVLGVLEKNDSCMGDRGREHCVSHFSSHVALRRFTDVYENLLGRNKVLSAGSPSSG